MKRPDWAKVAKRHRNMWQRLASATKGIVTWANVVTVAGFALLVAGLVLLAQEHYWPGFWVLLVSRLCDVADGWLAELTGTKSPLGEALDAGFDKLSVLLALIILPAASIVPLWAVVALVLPHLAIAGVSAAALRHGKRLHPSGVGKVSMALLWFSLGGFVLIKTLDMENAGALVAVVYALVASSVVTGLYAARGYAAPRR